MLLKGGSRIPSWSIVAKERDIYGELGWIPNFEVTYSKNNTSLHPTYKQFFDKPKDLVALDANATSIEYFRS